MMDLAEPVGIMGLLQKNLWISLSPYLLFLVLEMLFKVSGSTTQAEINNHLELGKQFLAKGQLSDALTHYHAAVEGDPNNYLTYFKRGTVYLALGKAKNALMDFDKVLELKPDFVAARTSRGTIHLKLANYDLAQLDFYDALQADPYNVEANELYHRIEPAKSSKESALYYHQIGDLPTAIHYMSEAIDASPWSGELFDMRYKMHMDNEDLFAAVSDLKAATKLESDNTEGYLKLATLLYQMGHATDSLKSIRECLKLDPDHKECFKFYKKVKKVEKFMTEAESSREEKNFAECVASAQKVLKHEDEEKLIVFEANKLLCSCYMGDEQMDEAITACGKALEINEDPNVYCDRAEAYLASELYDDAISDYKDAMKIDQYSDRAKKGLEKAKKLQMQSEKRDYYKILGVKRTASKKEIKDAYRKAALKWHPDKYHLDPKMKKIAEKKLLDITDAKQVLTDDEKRKQFDAGEDPLDPESGKFQNMPNFQFQFHNFHGSPFTFRHFN